MYKDVLRRSHPFTDRLLRADIDAEPHLANIASCWVRARRGAWHVLNWQEGRWPQPLQWVTAVCGESLTVHGLEALKPDGKLCMRCWLAIEGEPGVNR